MPNSLRPTQRDKTGAWRRVRRCKFSRRQSAGISNSLNDSSSINYTLLAIRNWNLVQAVAGSGGVVAAVERLGHSVFKYFKHVHFSSFLSESGVVANSVHIA